MSEKHRARSAGARGRRFRAVALLVITGVFGFVLVTANPSAAQVVATGVPDPETAGVFVFTAGTDGPDCTGTPGGTPTDDVVGNAITANVLAFFGASEAEVVSYTPGSDLESPNHPVDADIAAVVEGLTAIDDFGVITDGTDNTANADLGTGGQITLMLPERQVITADGVVADGALANGSDIEANLGGFEIFLFEDAEMSGMQVIVSGPTQNITFDIADYQLNPGTAQAADDMLLAIDLDSLAGWTDPFVDSVTFMDDGVDSGGVTTCFDRVQIDTSLEIDAVATRRDVVVLRPSISIEKLTNGQDADAAPGPELVAGDPVTWTYEVVNDGEQPLSGIVVTDDREGPVPCPTDTLAPGESMTCTLTGVASGVGTYTNLGTVVAVPESGGEITDSDMSNYTVLSAPSFDLNKLVTVEGETYDVSAGETGPLVPVGTEVQWDYVVTNTGNVALLNVVIVDDVQGPICTLAQVGVGEQQSCAAIGTTVAGQYNNRADATATDPNGTTITESDTSAYIGSEPGIAVVKTLGTSEDGEEPVLPAGSDVLFRFNVRNTGNVTLTDVVVQDDLYGEICRIASLATLAQETCLFETVLAAGPHENTATASGVDPLGMMVLDDDNAVAFGSQPSVSIEKTTNGLDSDEAPGASIAVGATVAWQYTIVNTGNVDLTGIVVMDDREGRVCERANLRVGETATCVIVGVAEQGTYTNTGTVTGATAEGLPVTASDPSNYTGVVGGLGDLVWIDANRNGLQDLDEESLAGVRVRLLPDPTSTSILMETTTGADGRYIFDNLPPGDYAIEFDAPDGFDFTTVNAGNPALDSDADPLTGRTGLVNAPAGSNNLDVDAGLTPNTVTIGDRVWFDRNQDGLQDPDEPGIPGIVIDLWDAETETVVETQITDENGNYLFVGSASDVTWRVQVRLPDGWELTQPNAGDDTIDSDADPLTGLTAAIPVEPGGENLDVDIGLVPREPSIELVVLSEDQRVDDGLPGPSVEAGTEVTLVYEVTNTGDWQLDDVRITDPVHGLICVVGTLDFEASATCTIEVEAPLGVVEADAIATGEPVDRDGNPALQLDGTRVSTVRDVDPLRYEGTQVLRATVVPSPTPVPPTATPVPTPTPTPEPVPTLALTGPTSSSNLTIVAAMLITAGTGLLLAGSRRRRTLGDDAR